jgi:hypothetical protein
MKTFQMNLPGYDSSRDDTDELVKWINAPNIEAAKIFAQKIGAEIDSVEELTHPWKMTIEDGVDYYVDERGEII